MLGPFFCAAPIRRIRMDLGGPASILNGDMNPQTFECFSSKRGCSQGEQPRCLHGHIHRYPARPDLLNSRCLRWQSTHWTAAQFARAAASVARATGTIIGQKTDMNLIWRFPEIGVPLNHDLNRIFHCKSSILDPPFMETPIFLDYSDLMAI